MCDTLNAPKPPYIVYKEEWGKGAEKNLYSIFEVVYRRTISNEVRKMQDEQIRTISFDGLEIQVIVKGKKETEPISFLDFTEAIQKEYLSLSGGRYQESIKLLPLIEGVMHRTGISRPQIEKWILELPRIFWGKVDLRPFGKEDGPGLYFSDGTEVQRIYLSRSIYGL